MILVINRAGGILPDFYVAFCQETAPDRVNGGEHPIWTVSFIYGTVYTAYKSGDKRYDGVTAKIV